MNVETVSGNSLGVPPCRRPFVTRRRVQRRLRPRLKRSSMDGVSLKPKRQLPPLNAAAVVDVGLAKDIYCAEPWWSRSPAPNMLTINSPDQMLDSMRKAGNRLVVIDFYAKWCRSCRALHPKLSQICRANPEVLLLKVDWDENIELCQAMGVKALPFFHFYQRPFGCVDSFTISVSRIRKLKDTIACYSHPMNPQTAHLAGMDSMDLDLAAGLTSPAAQLHKLGEIFSIS